MAKKPLQLVKQPATSFSIPSPSREDVENLDITKLRDTMLKGIYVLQSVLFSQAGYEFDRVQTLRGLIGNLEESLFSPEVLADLAPFAKIQLYELACKNMDRSLSFLQNQQKNITSGVETLHQLQEMKPKTMDPETDATADAALEQVKSLIARKIKEKVDGA